VSYDVSEARGIGRPAHDRAAQRPATRQPGGFTELDAVIQQAGNNGRCSVSRTKDALMDEEQKVPAVLRFYYEGQYKGELVVDYDPVGNERRVALDITTKMVEFGIDHAAVNVTGDPEYFSGTLWACFGSRGILDMAGRNEEGVSMTPTGGAHPGLSRGTGK